MYQFSEGKLRIIKEKIDHALSAGAAPIAAFDADGTLWATDVGENFFKYQYKNHLIEGLPSDPWAYYQNLYRTNRDQCYLWLAQINAGQSIQQVRKWAKESVTTHMHEMGEFIGQKHVIAHMIQRGVRVYIVTASVRWAVEPAARLFGVDPDFVVGIETLIDPSGNVTAEPAGPITHGPGKVEGLLRATGGVAPFFAAGNTESDLALLESATHLKFVVGSAPAGHDHRKTEQHMQMLAEERGWLRHQF